LVGDVADGDWFVAVGAEAAEVDAGGGAVAVGAPLLAQAAGAAVGALVDGDLPSWGSPGKHEGGWGCPVVVAGAPGGLAAGGCAVPLPSDRGEGVSTGGAR
jgi:hypothetical protein